MTINQHDNKILYCRMLGHEVPFSYCRCGVSVLPCRKIFDCWFQTFDIEQYVKEHFTKEQIKDILAPPKEKIVSLFELIQKAQKKT